MAEIVAAAATSHILMSPAGAEAPAAIVFDGMMKIGRTIRASKPDVLVVISSDHMFNIGPEETAPFIVPCANRFVPFGDMDIPREAYPGHPEFARGFAEFARARGETLAIRARFSPDHGVAVPLLFANSDHDIPVVPLLVNYDLMPPPSPADAWRLGRCLKAFIQMRPARERVAVLAGGGLSHWVGFEDAPVNAAFDSEFLAAFGSGQVEAWQKRSAEDIRAAAGNGGLEVMSWMMMAATVPGARAETVYYQEMPSWLTGMGGIIMNLEPANLSGVH